jgi:hypothetical protein
MKPKIGGTMDTSKEYIQMCRAAEEIQEVWIPTAWDYIFCLNCIERDDDYEKVVIISGYETDLGFYGHGVGEMGNEFYCSSDEVRLESLSEEEFKRTHIWLPRQDQLQAMLVRDVWYLEQSFHCWFLECSGIKSGKPQYSMEQLWLAFVMHELYGKVWEADKQKWTKPNP